MAEERQRQEGEGDRPGTPFDEDPPVDPKSEQVGNSKARFFVPSEEEPEKDEDGDEQGESGEESDGDS